MRSEACVFGQFLKLNVYLLSEFSRRCHNDSIRSFFSDLANDRWHLHKKADDWEQKASRLTRSCGRQTHDISHMLTSTNRLHLNSSWHLVPKSLDVLHDFTWHGLIQIVPLSDWIWHHLPLNLNFMVFPKDPPVSGGQAADWHVLEMFNRIVRFVEFAIEERILFLLQDCNSFDLLRCVLLIIPFKLELSLFVGVILS